MNILFLGGAKRVSIAQYLQQYGQENGVEINIFSYELDNIVPIASVGKVIIGLKWNDVRILDDLIKTVEKYKINIILPFVDPAIAIAAKLKHNCPNVFIPVSEEQLCAIMFDKKCSANWFNQHNISQPSFYPNIMEVKYPIILKPRTGSASKGLIVCMRPSDLPIDLDYEQYLIQRYIGECVEYSVDCYVDQKGSILSIVPRIRLEVLGGEAVKSVVVKEKSIIAAAKRILLCGGFYGPITIQFIKDLSDKNIYVMEINPRLGGAVVASIGAGSGLISFIVQEALNEPVSAVENWRDGTIMTRYFKDVIFHADNN